MVAVSSWNTEEPVRLRARTFDQERRYKEVLQFVALILSDDGVTDVSFDVIVSRYTALTEVSLSDGQIRELKLALRKHPNFHRRLTGYSVRV